MLATLRVLMQQYKESELATRKRGILEVLREFITASKNLYGSIEKSLQNLGTYSPCSRSKMFFRYKKFSYCFSIGLYIDADFVTPLSTYKDDYMEMFSSALLNQNEYNELRLCGLCGLYDMILLHQFLNDNEIGVILQYFNRAVSEETDQEIA